MSQPTRMLLRIYHEGYWNTIIHIGRTSAMFALSESPPVISLTRRRMNGVVSLPLTWPSYASKVSAASEQ